MAAELPEKEFPAVRRILTTHETSGETTFETPIAEEIEWTRSNELGADFFLAYTLSTFPVPLKDDADMKQYAEHLVNPPQVVIPGGAIVRYVDFHPNGTALWHRNVTLDVGVVIEGELELELESGEKRLLRRGDVNIKRGTRHRVHNPSKTKFARALFVALSARPVVIDGKELGESWG